MDGRRLTPDAVLDWIVRSRAPFVTVSCVEVPEPGTACARDRSSRMPVGRAVETRPLPHGPGCECTYLPALSLKRPRLGPSPERRFDLDRLLSGHPCAPPLGGARAAE